MPPATGNAMRYRKTLVTPAMARRWLEESNPKNRNKKPAIIEAITADIRNGRWDADNGETIKFNVDGDLEDGQNRLYAIVEADQAVEVLVVYNVRVGAHETIDTGARRTLADTLKMRGEKYWTQVGAVLRRVYLWQHGCYVPGSPILRPSQAQLLSLYEDKELAEELRHAVRVAYQVRQVVRVNATALAFGFWVCHGLEDPQAAEDAEFFFSRLQKGSPPVAGEATYELRRTFERRVAGGVKTDEVTVVALLFKAWNAYRDGRRVQTLVYKAGGRNPEPFPFPR